jgi:hypothetical protein
MHRHFRIGKQASALRFVHSTRTVFHLQAPGGKMRKSIPLAGGKTQRSGKMGQDFGAVARVGRTDGAEFAAEAHP